MTWLAMTGNEVSGYGRVSVWRHDAPIATMPTVKRIAQDGDYGFVIRVEDVWLLDHGSMAETNITPAQTDTFLQDIEQANIDPSTIKLWWHRHPLTKGTPS